MRVIQSLRFGPDAIEVTYMDESDVRLGGKAYLVHSLNVARASYSDDVAHLEEETDALLTDVLGDWARSLPMDMEQREEEGDDDDDDDEG